MLREKISCALKTAEQNDQKKRVATLRLINAAIQDRDAASREQGKDGLSEDELVDLLETMLEQRLASSAATLVENGELKGEKPVVNSDTAVSECEEVQMIRELLPPQLSDYEMKLICSTLVERLEAKGLRDMGRCMSELKTRYPGQMDFTRASCLVKQILSSPH
ncbi:GatB/YqeY domain-containing protein [Polycladidibacter hongkongensis]|uniref:GatB/YqeY domain-containing protein n=1 Tax=Polycladidibacter hongkongensis TaxID=1647556 RepID=UPI0008317B4B|nr:GatB/YqeY domain-containing protein [Pseudovibrio hongkongensis]